MVNLEIVDYIKRLRERNTPEGQISENLLKAGWGQKEIQEALVTSSPNPAPIQNNSSVSPQSPPTPVQTPTISLSTPSVQPTNEPINIPSQETKPKIIKIISVLLFLLFALYIVSTLSFLGIIYVLYRSAISIGPPQTYSFLEFYSDFIKSFPVLAILPAVLSTTSFLFSYDAFKIRGGSKFSYYLSLLSLIFIPLPVEYFCEEFTHSFLNKSTAPYSLKTFNPVTIGLILTLISLILLLFAFKKFNFPNQKLSLKVKVFLAIIFIVFVIPSYIFSTVAYLKARDTDCGYEKVKSMVNYHVYKPTILGNRTCFEKYSTNSEIAGKSNGIFIMYDFPVKFTTQKPSPIGLKQVGVDPDFNLESFVSATIKNQVTSEQIPLSISLNQKANFIKTTRTQYLIFIMPGDVLIYINAPSENVTNEELAQFAESLK